MEDTKIDILNMIDLNMTERQREEIELKQIAWEEGFKDGYAQALAEIEGHVLILRQGQKEAENG